jgi:hypothetical protein
VKPEARTREARSVKPEARTREARSPHARVRACERAPYKDQSGFSIKIDQVFFGSLPGYVSKQQQNVNISGLSGLSGRFEYSPIHAILMLQARARTHMKRRIPEKAT